MRKPARSAVTERIAPRLRTCRHDISSRSTFTIRISMSMTLHPDGVLDRGSGDVKGPRGDRRAIARDAEADTRRRASGAASARPTTSRTSSVQGGRRQSGITPRIGSTIQRATRKGVSDRFGHYEDELVRVNGKWLFTKRKIYHEGRDEWAYKGGKNPAW